MSRVQVLNDATFSEDNMKSGGMVAMLFWTPWCGHCGPYIPEFEELSDNLTGAAFFTVNKDESIKIANKYGVSSVPSFVFLRNGELMENHLGGLSKEGICHRLEYYK